jgi:hypothetical protein
MVANTRSLGEDKFSVQAAAKQIMKHLLQSMASSDSPGIEAIECELRVSKRPESGVDIAAALSQLF